MTERTWHCSIKTDSHFTRSAIISAKVWRVPSATAWPDSLHRYTFCATLVGVRFKYTCRRLSCWVVVKIIGLLLHVRAVITACQYTECMGDESVDCREWRNGRHFTAQSRDINTTNTRFECTFDSVGRYSGVMAPKICIVAVTHTNVIQCYLYRTHVLA